MVCSFFFLICPFLYILLHQPEVPLKLQQTAALPSRCVILCIMTPIASTTQMCSQWHVVFFSALIHTEGDSALAPQLALRNTDPCCGGWTPGSSSASTCLFVVPQCTAKNRRQEGELRLFSRTTAGILQPNGHVFTLGCFLISQCNGNNIKKKSSGLLFSKQSNSASTIGQQFSKSPLDVLSTEWQMDIDWQDTLLNDALL